VARFVRLRDEPDVADVAIAVADRYQRKGLGRVLISRLIEAAKERGIRTLRAEVLATNVAAFRLFSAIATEAVHQSFGTVIVIEVPVDTRNPYH
jgi:ribosomal protein S18 acetylase RimI-like enzyme